MSNSNELAARKAKLDEARRRLLAKRLKGSGRAAEAADRIVPHSSEEPVPLSYSQQRFWFLQQLDPDAPTYNMHEAWRVRGPLDLAALEQAFNQVIARHAVLRTSIGVVDDVPVQKVAPVMNLAILCHELSHLEGEEQTAALEQIAVQEARALFDLNTGPLLRLTAVRSGDNDHALLLTIHHIISDEYANDLFWRDLNAFYQVEMGQRAAADLPELTIQYKDFTAWQIEWLKQGEEARQLAYWQQRLAGESEPIELPFDRPRPPQQSFKGGFARRHFDPTVISGVQRLAQETGATPFMIFMAAFQAVLNRYGRQNDIWVGTPIANRQREEVKALMGLFLNTIILRSQIDETTTFRQLIEQVKQHAFDGLAHQDVPFERLVEALKPRRDPAIHPLFQVMFVYSPIADGAPRSLANLAFEPLATDGGVAKFDLTLFVGSNDERIEAAYEYNADLFDRQTVDRLLEHLELFVTAAVAQPGVPVATLPLLTAAERQRIAEDLAPPTPPSPKYLLLHEYFMAQAAARPNQTAVWAEEGTMSYGELDRRANQLAHFLQERGVGPATVVGVVAERRSETIIGILAVLKAGGAYVPLDPEYPAERLEHIITDTGLQLALATAPNLAAQFKPFGVETVALNRFPYDTYSAAPPKAATEPENLAYVIFTSGSTGRPKGVMVSHANIVHSTSARFAFYPHQAERFLLLSSFAFDSSMVGLFWTLTQGGTLVLPGPGRQQDVLFLADMIHEQGVTHLLALPSLYQLLLEESEAGQLNSLNTVMVAGEACHPALVQSHNGRLPHTLLYNEYGPTEGTVWSHAYRFPVDFGGPAVPIGRPIPGVTQQIVDPQLRPVPLGVAGELLIGGPGITRGYLGRPDLTAEKFIELPTADSPTKSARFYRTGDLVRMRPDGEVVFLGRVDDQVKIRGFRIELGEIEAALTALPPIHEAVVTIFDRAEAGQRPDKRLAAFFVADQPLESGDLRQQLTQRLPAYMIPVVWQQLEQLPRTPNGKIDRQALPDPLEIDQPQPDAFVAASGSVEETLSTVWQDVLRLPQVGRHDNFFDLGGDSIIGIQIVARARRAGLQINPRQLFEHQTIAELATVAAAVGGSRAQQGLVTGTFELTPIQAWFFEQQFADPNRWNQSLWVTPTRWDSGDETFLTAAADHLLSQHDALRLCFAQDLDGRWQQSLPATRSGGAPLVTIVDLGHVAEEERESAMHALAVERAKEIDLTCGELMRGAIFLLGDQQPPRIFLTVHHLAIDGVSWGPLLEDWATAFTQLKQGQALSLPPKTTSVKRWAQGLASYGQQPTVQQEADFWQAQFGDGIANQLAAGTYATSGTRQVVQTLPVTKTDALLTDVHTPFNTTINDILLTALVQAMHKSFSIDQLALLLEGHGRETAIGDDLDVARTVGWFTTQFPVRLSLGRAQSPADTIKQIKEQLRQLPENGIGYGVLRYLVPDSGLAERPEPAFTFNYLGQLERSLLASDFFALRSPLTPIIGPENHRPHGLGLMVYVQNGVLQAVFDYHPDQIDGRVIEGLAASYGEALQDLIEYCLNFEGQEKTASDFDLVDFDNESFGDLADLLGDLG